MSDTRCPYCGSKEEINHDDGYGYEEDTPHQQDCGACGRTYVFQTSIYFSYSTKQAPCLNGESHEYQPSFTCPIEYTKMECAVCGHRREPTDGEMAAVRASRQGATA